MTEDWRDIIGYEGFYQVSNLARVRSLDREIFIIRRNGEYTVNIKGRILKPVSHKGYDVIILAKDGLKLYKKIHRLMMEAFVPNPNNYPCVNHMDGNRGNNSIDNLEWCTYSQNTIHAVNTGLLSAPKGVDCHSSKLSDRDVLTIYKFIKEKRLLKEIANEFNISASTISQIKLGNIWSHLTGISRCENINKLKKEDIFEIIKLFKDGIKPKIIAHEFNVDQDVVYNLLNGRTYSKITGINYNPKKKA